MSEFNNLYAHGLVRVAAASPRVHLADPLSNAKETISLMQLAHNERAALLVFPELGISGYSLEDLHLQSALLASVETAISDILTASKELFPVTLIGAPLRIDGAVFGCAIALHRGRILGVIPKTYLPNYREFYEKRQFASAFDVRNDTALVCGSRVPFGANLLFAADDVPDLVIGAEICEDVWSALPPSTYAALAGASVIANLSASNITIGKRDERDLYCASQSARSLCGYIYSAAGYGETTTDTAWDGQVAIYELGACRAQSARFVDNSDLLFTDLDLEMIVQERMRTPTFRDCARSVSSRLDQFRTISFHLDPPLERPLSTVRSIARFPYVPDDAERLDLDCFEACSIQVQGLRRRLESSRVRKAIIGVSGGLDSTQALLVAVRAFDLMDRPRSDIIAVTMPGFATTEATRSSAHALMKELKVDGREVDIRPLAQQMFKDLDHPFARGEQIYDVTFENVQAGLRTDYLFRLANQEGGLVVGTGDLSELALGWCTYGVGDHMSHYNVNASVPKTLIQHLIRWSSASGHYSKAVARVLADILATEISPELVPAGTDGRIQSTETLIGPYALHDFFLYYTLRHGLSPRKIAFLAQAAWTQGSQPGQIPDDGSSRYSVAEILHWLEVFVLRFFETSQFKRSVAVNGPKVTRGGSLSPRGDWRAPSDSSAAPWLADIRRLRAEIG